MAGRVTRPDFATRPDCAIRPAAPAELPALHRLVEGAYRGDGARIGWTHEADLLATPRTDAPTLAAMLAAPGETLLAAERGGVLVGCVHVRVAADGPAYLGMLTVRPALQGAGIGSALMAAADAWARARGAATMEMTVIDSRAELIAFYERRGWRRTGERRPFPAAVVPPLAFVVLARELAA